MKLNVPILSQRDPRWANQRLGTVDGTTIGGYGCIITCMTMLAQYYGHNLTPADMDNWLTDNQGYVQGNLYRNDAFGREFSDCSFDSIVFCTDAPAPLDQIDHYLKQGKPVVVMVDFDHDPNDGIQTHFVLIVGKTNDGVYFINDPWFGDQVYFTARYGDQAAGINQINFFSGTVPQLPQPTVIQPTDSTPAAQPVEQPTPETVVTSTQVDIPVTTSSGETNVPITTTSSDNSGVPNQEQSAIQPPVETKPILPHGPTKPSMDIVSTIVWILMNIKSVLLKLWKNLNLK